MVKFELPMPYWDNEIAVANIDGTIGFHKNGKYWTYKKYTPEETLNIIEKFGKYRSLEIKVASQNSGSKSEL